MIEFEVNPESLKLYRDYAYERSRVYIKKEAGQDRPWTTDPILANYKFTNINRRLDRESKWLIDNVCENDNLSTIEKVLNCAVFRCVNYGQAMDGLYGGAIKFDSMPKSWYDELRDSQYRGKVQSNAYFLSHVRAAANRHCKKHYDREGYAGTAAAIPVFIRDHKSIIQTAYNGPDPEYAFNGLCTISSFGKFISYQIWVDWCYIPESKWDDDTYTVSGPGCDQGINWMVYGPESGGKKWLHDEIKTDNVYEKFLYWFRANLQSLMNNAGLEWDESELLSMMPENLQRWGLMETENSFCEFAKYMKLRSGVKMRVRKY